MLTEGLFTKEEYLFDLDKINRELFDIRNVTMPEKWLLTAKGMLSIGAEIVNTFKSDTRIESKRKVLSKFGSNLIWDEKKLIITSIYPIQQLIDGLNEAKAKNGQFEPKTTLADKEQDDVFESVCPTLCSMWVDVRNKIIAQQKEEE